MKEQWFIEWLEEHGYSFWYEENDNEVWINTEFTVIWHPAHGMRFKIPNEIANEEYLANVLR